MRIGVYLGRHAGQGGGIAVYANSLVKGALELLEEPAHQELELVLYGDRTILTPDFLRQADLSSVLSTKAGLCTFFSAQKYFRELPNGRRCRVLIRELPMFLGRHIGFFMDQLMLPLVVWRDRPDLIHAVANYGIMYCPKPQAATVHDLYQAWPLAETVQDKRKPQRTKKREAQDLNQKENGSSPLRHSLFKFVYRLLFKHQFRFLAQVITDTKEIAEQVYRRYHYNPAHITVVPLGLDQVFVDFIDQARSKEGLGDKSVEWLSEQGFSEGYLLVFASSDPRKNLQRTLEAWLQLPEELRTRGLVIKCADRDSMRLVKKILGPQLTEQVVLLSWLPREELPYLYYHASVVLVPTLGEGFGLPVIEALSLGRVVVSAPLEVLQGDCFSPEKVYLCNPRETESIAAGIEQACAYVDVNSGSGPPNVRVGTSAYTMCAMVQQTFSVYKEMVLRHKGGKF